MKRNGVTLREGDETVTVRSFVTDDARQAGIQDYVFISVKAHTLPQAAEDVAAMMGPETALITAQNGVPYWYFHGLDSPWRDHVIESVDPRGELWRTLPPEHVIGSVLYPWAEISAPASSKQPRAIASSSGEPDGTEAPIKNCRGSQTGRLERRHQDIRADNGSSCGKSLVQSDFGRRSTIDRDTGAGVARWRAMMVEAERRERLACALAWTSISAFPSPSSAARAG
jgi:hypothetical protein